MFLVAPILIVVITLLVRRDRLRKIPGPVLARWTPLWLGYQARMGRRYLAVDEAHKAFLDIVVGPPCANIHMQKYGPVVRITPTHVSVAHPDAVAMIYGHSPAFNKSEFYDAFVAETPSVFSTTDRKDHSAKRRIVSQAFSYRALEQFTPFIHNNIVNFVGQLDSMCDTGRSIDILKWLHFLTFDVLADLAFGEPLGMLASGTSLVSVQRSDGTMKKEDAIALVEEREHLSAVLGIHPWFPFLARIIPDRFFWSGHESSNALTDFAQRNVSKRLTSGAYRENILEKLIAAHKCDGQVDPETIKELVAATVTLLTAGFDTTGSSVAALIYLVKTHPLVHRKLNIELEAVIDRQEIPNHRQVKDLPYLQAVIEEGLRHYAIMATGLPRLVPEGGVEFFGQQIPAGTEVSVPAFTIQHAESIWGDPEVFRPERWLESSEQHKYLSRYLLAFGKGPRTCLGKNLAYMEIQLILATVILRYDVELESEHLESTEGFVHKPEHVMVKLFRKV
ncbi:benzoate para-hydroxylase [Mycena maculata]|uniref:Benzoate para-hydroxylase n=1 Tax=Mycena maculata TaxID=230809 RepID=A0AAD7NB63_9AGAR|nr:benzoate para-hydroxylase [Mycena maculata]